VVARASHSVDNGTDGKPWDRVLTASVEPPDRHGERAATPEYIGSMNPIVFALRRPLTVIVAVVAVALASGAVVFASVLPNTLVGRALTKFRMPIDIFPNLNLPVIYGGDDQLRHAFARLHASRHGLAVRDPVRCGRRAGRLPGAVE
jgi:hypothetical protein